MDALQSRTLLGQKCLLPQPAWPSYPCPFPGWLLPTSICSGNPRLPLKQRELCSCGLAVGKRPFWKGGCVVLKRSIQKHSCGCMGRACSDSILLTESAKVHCVPKRCVSQQKPRCAAEKPAKIYSRYSTAEPALRNLA